MTARDSAYSITSESFATLSLYWRTRQSALPWECFFVLPTWLEVWWNEFGLRTKPYSCVVKQKDNLIGIAPLFLEGDEASFIGSADVCDHLDFVVAPGNENEFFNVILDDLFRKGVTCLNLRPLRPESTVLTHLVDIAKVRGHKVSCKIIDVSLELDLPSTWEGYLEILNPKQRHEVRRKLRRLQEKGTVTYRTIEGGDAALSVLPLFLRLFRESNRKKRAFMTPKMESFFISLVKAMADAGLLSLGVLEIDANPVALVICFDYGGSVYLYNNGYDFRYRSLSVGLMSKVFSIKDSIAKGKKKFDFLKGAEAYKYRLGGKEIPLYDCRILLT